MLKAFIITFVVSVLLSTGTIGIAFATHNSKLASAMDMLFFLLFIVIAGGNASSLSRSGGGSNVFNGSVWKSKPTKNKHSNPSGGILHFLVLAPIAASIWIIIGMK